MTEKRIVFENPFEIEGKVVHGKALGRTVGMPTANLEVSDKFFLPEDGVYATLVFLDEKTYKGMTNVGKRPSVDNEERTTVETFILDFDGDIYGKTLKLRFEAKVRDVMKFNSLAEVKSQVDKDILAVSKIL